MTTPIQYQGSDVSLDPILQKRGTEAGPWLHGRMAVTGEDALNVLAVLQAHLMRTNDATGQQLLARIWRINSPVVDLLANGRERMRQMNEGLQKIGNMLDLKVGDSVPDVAPAALRKVIDDAEMLRDFIELCGHLQDGSHQPVTVDQDDATNQAIVRVGTKHNHARFVAGSIRSAIRMAIDGTREQEARDAL